MSKLQVDDIVNKDDTGSVGFSRGVVVTGVMTATTFSGTVSSSTGSFSGDVDIADKIVHTGDTNTAIRFPAADTFTVETAGSERLRVGAAGSVAINETSPQNQLHVHDDTSYQGIFVNGNGAPRINFARSTTTTAEWSVGVDGTDGTKFAIAQAGNTAKLTITTGGVVEIPGDVSIGDKIIHTGDTDTAIRFPAANTFTVETAGSEAIRVDSSQRLLVNTATTRNNYDNGSVTSNLLHVERTAASGNAGISICANAATAADVGAILYMGRTSATSNGGSTIVEDDDLIGRISFQGADGSELVEAASIKVDVDGTPGSNDMPGRIEFHTNAGGTSATERMRIDSSGRMGLGTGTPDSYIGDGDNFVIAESASAGLTIATGTSNTGTINFADGTSGDARYRGRFEYNHSTDALDILTAATTHMRIHSGGVVSFNSGIELGSGIDGTAANTLDDYEEGTFTPSINTGFTASYNTQSGRYTKVGNVVHFFISIDLSSLSGSSSDTYAEVEGLPFTATNTGNIDNAVTVAWQMNLGNNVIHAYVEGNAAYIVLLGEPQSGSRTHWSPGEVWDDSDGRIALSGTYTTTA